MATATLLPLPRFVAYDPTNGAPLAGGLVSQLVPGGTTPKTSWQDAAETIPNANPLTLDAAGSALIYGSGSYQLTVTDALGNAIPAYSGVTTTGDIVDISAAMTPVVEAGTVQEGFNLLAADGGTVGAALTVEGVLSAQNGATVTGGSGLTISGNLAETTAGVYTNSQFNLSASFLLGGVNPGALYEAHQPGNNATYAMTAANAVPSGSTVHEAGGVLGMVSCNVAGTNCVGGAFYSLGLVAGSNLFGLNVLCDDGDLASTIVGCEWDIGAINPATITFGNNMIGAFPNGTPTTSVGYQVGALSHPWGIGFNIPDGSAVVSISIGASSTANNSDGQEILLTAKDSTGTDRQIAIAAQHLSAGANLALNTPTGGVVMSAAELTSGLGTFAAAILVLDAGGTLCSFQSGVTPVGSITTNGTTTTYNTTSDRRLKDLHGDADGSVIDALRVYTGSFKAAPDIRRAMLVADETQKVAPWAVTGEPDAEHAEDVVSPTGRVLRKKGDIIPQMVDYSMLVPDLIAKCQALTSELAAMKNELAALKGSRS